MELPPTPKRSVVRSGRTARWVAVVVWLAVIISIGSFLPTKSGLMDIFLQLLKPDCRNTRAGNSMAFYGSGLQADALGNTRIGGPFMTTTSYRFRADHTGQLQAVRFYVIWSDRRKGYHGGTGGALLVSLQPDDGTVNHAPSGETLTSVLHEDPLHKDHFPLLNFSSPVLLEAGSLYHLVFTNPDRDPSSNFVSVDCLLTEKPTSPTQPGISDTDWGQMLGTVGKPRQWTTRMGYTPILELSYADGYSSGMGYMEVWIGNPKQISGAAAVREIFTVQGPDRTVTAVAVRLRRLSGSEPLEICLEQADGLIIERRSVPALEVDTSYGWVSSKFDSLVTLKSGSTYHLLLRSAVTTCYEAFPLAKGTPESIGFTCNTVFADGYAQFTAGSSWTGWDQWGQDDRRDGDLQFFFTVARQIQSDAG